MRRHVGILVLGALVVLLLLIYTVAYQVSLTDLVVVTTFGQATEVRSGRDANQMGLHFKWFYPAQEAVRFDARTFLFEDALDETQTKDKKAVLPTVFLAWRIEDPQRFLASIRTVQAAEDTLRSLVRGAKTDAFGKYDLAELINTDANRMKLRDVEDRISRRLSGQKDIGPVAATQDANQGPIADVRRDYGIGIVMVGIKRLALSGPVSEKAIEAMQQERKTAADAYRASGEARAMAIRERARAAAEKILAFAKRKADEIRAEGAKAEAEYYVKFLGHEDLAIFLRNLEMMRTLNSRTVLLLDESMLPFLKMFREPPTAATIHQMATSAPAATAPSR
jgi:modulator of FtsH protease HflC